MRISHFAILCLIPFFSSVAVAQVKDSHGEELRIGLPLKPVPDYDGGMISKGRAAKCVIDNEPAEVCTFYARNGNGSFAIDATGMAYYADKLSANQIDVDYDNGARMVPQGIFTRSTKDAACWVQRSKRKICVY